MIVDSQQSTARTKVKFNEKIISKSSAVKAKFHYASWFEAGRRPAVS